MTKIDPNHLIGLTLLSLILLQSLLFQAQLIPYKDKNEEIMPCWDVLPPSYPERSMNGSIKAGGM